MQTDHAPPVRWGILGTARIATKVAAAIQQASGAELTAIASRSREKAADWAATWNVPHAFASYEELLQCDEIDAVYIPLPPSLHAEWSTRAAEQGKHVLCEKPLGGTLADARAIVAACERANVQLMDGVMWRHTPRAQAMEAVLRAGTLGTLKRFTSAFTFRWDPLPLEDLRFRPELGGGALLDLGWYCVGAALWAFGSSPRRVLGDARWIQGVDLAFNALMWFDDDRVGSFDVGFDTVSRRWFEIAGTDGNLVCDDFTRPWPGRKPRFWTHDAQGASTQHSSEDLLQERCMVEAFCRAVRSGTRQTEWPRFALETQRVCDALLRSARAAIPIDL